MDIQEAPPMQMPQAGEMLKASVTKLGMSTALEIYGEDAENPEQEILVVFFENESEGVKGKTPIAYYKRPTVRSKLFKYIRKWGQPHKGQEVMIVRDENGYWGLDL